MKTRKGIPSLAFLLGLPLYFWLSIITPPDAAAQSATTPAVPFVIMEGTLTDKPVPPETPAPAPTLATDTAEAPATTPEVTPEQKRIQKFVTLKFDRRLSNVLKTRSISEAEALADEPEPENADPSAPEKDPLDEQIDLEFKAFELNIVLGEWSKVADYIGTQFAESDRKKAYLHLLRGLLVPPPVTPNPAAPPSLPGQPQPNRPPKQPELQFLDLNDIVGLADASPFPLDRELIQYLTPLLTQAFARGDFIDDLLATLREGTKRLGGNDPELKRAAARLLIAVDHAAEAGEFLPTPEQAIADQNLEGLNLLALYFVALYEKEKKIESLEKAWEMTQAELSSTGLPTEQKEEALERALELTPKIREELGQAWLTDSFTNHPERGMEILGTVGTITARSQSEVDPQVRLKKLELQATAVEALLKSAPDRAKEWANTLHLLALNWLSEAEYTRLRDQSDSSQPNLRFDQYGNMYYDSNRYGNNGQPGQNKQPIATGDMLDNAPSEAWMKFVSDSMQPKFSMILAQLHLKVKEDEKAFPYIEAIARSHPETALELAHEFLDIWTANHNPNTDRYRTSYYYYSYGFNTRAESIPLTRSKQVRNLKELADWITRLRAMEIGDLDEDRLSKAFMQTHSAAEVYRLEDIEHVFGSLEDLKPETIASLVQTMRRNLATVWKKPEVQQQQKTKRKDKEIQADIERGYGVAHTVMSHAVEKHPESWQLQIAKAAVMFDRNNFEQELQKSSEFVAKKKAAFAEFAKGAALYQAALPKLEEDKHTAEAYETWFYASLGACDLGALKHEQQPDAHQQELIREALNALPLENRENHIGRFANSLSSRIGSVQPELKHRYLKAGLAIAGEHKQARQARQVFEYYKDLVTEIKLDARLDGTDTVGHTLPFGLYVNIRHTQHIERESGGFSKYLVNQQNNPYSYNYGRPAENYRDKFEESAREILSEHFEVMSVTFHSEKIESRGDPEQGWRVTPYAYLLMKPKGPEIDSIPSLRMDFDFLDTSGFAVLPIESPRIPINARPDAPGPRPIENLKISQTLDERQAKDGKLVLEVKASAHGLLPEFNDLLEFAPEQFDITAIDDQGLSVVELDAERDDGAAICERNWMVELKAKAGLEKQPTTFQFATAKAETEEFVFQRYQDADLASATQVISLEQRYGEPQSDWIWGASVAGFILIMSIAGFFVLRGTPGRDIDDPTGYRIPDEITPFSIVTLLRRIHSDAKLSDNDRSELGQSIAELERHFFNRGSDAASPDLKAIAENWIRKAA
ncbi:MAG: hypothetical protein KDN22_15390 [Verrucomicrobiae bacterium]|nr:hypothetical protein [Verrucomicrobiae bacterium]